MGHADQQQTNHLKILSTPTDQYIIITIIIFCEDYVKTEVQIYYLSALQKTH
jgi:hypothetical protein